MIDYIPILTTILSIYFFIEIYRHYSSKKKKYLLWWMLGVVTFGLGTLSESLHALIGYNEFNQMFLRYVLDIRMLMNENIRDISNVSNGFS